MNKEEKTKSKAKNTAFWSKAGKLIKTVGKPIVAVVVPVAIALITKGKK